MGMKMNRRDLLFASGLFLLPDTRASGPSVAPPRPKPQTPGGPAARLLESLRANRLPPYDARRSRGTRLGLARPGGPRCSVHPDRRRAWSGGNGAVLIGPLQDPR